jgi:two-component system response regulator FixJ
MPDEPADPLNTFRAMLEGARHQSSAFAERQSRAAEAVSKLSEPERRMLGQIVAGWSNRDIAADHGVDAGVFESLRSELLRKINAASTSDAVRTGIYAGLG